MASRLNPYVNFKNRAAEAMNFYKSVFGGELQLMTFGQSGSQDPAEKDLIMHGQLETPAGFTLMGSDTPPRMEYRQVAGISISLSGEDEKELRGYWDKLAQGATITQPLEKAPWGDSFGMLTDKYGTPWLVNISAPK